MGKATERMVTFACKIADALGYQSELQDMLNETDNFELISDFINDFKSEYYCVVRNG